MPRVNRHPIALTEIERGRFWDRVNITPYTTHEDCWPWTRRTDDFGYGLFRVRSRHLKAHRVAWTLERGAIPDDKTLDHVCRNPRCVNPSHLELVSNKENILRGESFSAKNGQKTHCPQGHPFTPENMVKGGAAKSGRRVCLKCEAAKMRARRVAGKVKPRRNEGDD